jgi:hypothetical protein
MSTYYLTPPDLVCSAASVDEVPYVSEEAIRLAGEWERRFQALPPQAGVVFVSIRPRPAFRGQVKVFDVRVGVIPKVSESLGVTIAKNVLEPEFRLARYQFAIEAWSGLPVASDHERAGVDPL